MRSPSLFGSQENHETHISLSQVLVQNPLLGLTGAVVTGGVHSSNSVRSRIHQREIVKEVEDVMRLIIVVAGDKT